MWSTGPVCMGEESECGEYGCDKYGMEILCVVSMKFISIGRVRCQLHVGEKVEKNVNNKIFCGRFLERDFSTISQQFC